MIQCTLDDLWQIVRGTRRAILKTCSSQSNDTCNLRHRRCVLGKKLKLPVSALAEEPVWMSLTENVRGRQRKNGTLSCPEPAQLGCKIHSCLEPENFNDLAALFKVERSCSTLDHIARSRSVCSKSEERGVYPHKCFKLYSPSLFVRIPGRLVTSIFHHITTPKWFL